MPSMMTRSAGVRPDRITRRPPRRSPISTCLGTTVPSSATVMTLCCDWSGSTAVSGINRACIGAPTTSLTRANSPGVRRRLGFGTVARAWIVPLDRLSTLSTKSSVPCRTNCVSSLRAISTLSAVPSLHPRTVSGKDQEIGLAHVEIQIDRIERDERREQSRGAGRGTAAGDQVADGDEMSADAPREGCRDTAALEIELSITDLSLRIVHGRLRGSLVGRALVDGLFRNC